MKRNQKIPTTIQSLLVGLGRFVAEHEDCLQRGFTMEANTEFIYCGKCHHYTNINKK